jgi:succinyl-CoA synthetase alpha subunit
MSILVDQNTRVMISGVTGREGQMAARLMLKYQTKVVAGVNPGRGGETVEGIPVYDSMNAARKDHQADAVLVYVPPSGAADSIIEAVEAGIGLVVVITERVPIHEASEALAIARDKGTVVVGPNSLGVISPGKAKIGTIGGEKEARCFVPGPVGVISRSGGMTTETSWMVKQAGFGCSTSISSGGDYLIGASFAELTKLFEADPETKAVVLFCEAGTSYEEELAECIESGVITKPVIAYVAGGFLAQIQSQAKFGHAGAILEKGRSTREIKRRLAGAGVRVAEEYDDIIPLVQQALGGC